MIGNVEPSHCDPEKELQCRHRAVDAARRNAPRGQVKLVAPDILERRLVRRTAKEDRELLDEANIIVLGRRPKLTDRHILDHAASQRAYGRIGHEVLQSGWKFANAPSSDRTPPVLRPR